MFTPEMKQQFVCPVDFKNSGYEKMTFVLYVIFDTIGLLCWQ
jgi:hypothetical protein